MSEYVAETLGRFVRGSVTSRVARRTRWTSRGWTRRTARRFRRSINVFLLVLAPVWLDKAFK